MRPQSGGLNREKGVKGEYFRHTWYSPFLEGICDRGRATLPAQVAKRQS